MSSRQPARDVAQSPCGVRARRRSGGLRRVLRPGQTGDFRRSSRGQVTRCRVTGKQVSTSAAADRMALVALVSAVAPVMAEGLVLAVAVGVALAAVDVPAAVEAAADAPV